MPDSDSRFDATPEEAIAAIDSHRGPIVVDLDETLLLANSTSLFLDSVRPAFLAYLVVKLADIIRPRRASSVGGDRDVRRVSSVLRALPWSGWWWRRRVPRLIPDLLNRTLIDAIATADGPLVIATKGFAPVVEPVIAQTGLKHVTVVAMDPRSDEDRNEAKFRLTNEAVAPSNLGSSLVVTDSMADRRLLEASSKPLRVIWPMATVDSLFANLYIPGRYLGIKRPNGRYIRTILREDIALWILGSAWLAANPASHVVGLAVLALSFWAVYELGYLDNDRAAERFERDPVLSELYFSRGVVFGSWKPLLLSLMTGVAGLWILRWPESVDLFDYARWGGVVGGTWLIFRIYNRVDKRTRIALYPLLQLARLGAFLAVVNTTPIADMALIVIASFRSMSYLAYRSSEGDWPSQDVSVPRLIVFAGGALLLASQHEWSDLVDPTTLSLLAWLLLLARHELPVALSRAHRIDRPN